MRVRENKTLLDTIYVVLREEINGCGGLRRRAALSHTLQAERMNGDYDRDE